MLTANDQQTGLLFTIIVWTSAATLLIGLGREGHRLMFLYERISDIGP